jgi:predicted dehydrogenase
MKWAIAGFGYMGKKFLQDASKLDNVEVVAVASESTLSTDNYDSEFNFYKGYSELFYEPNFDAVYIATTPNKHYRILEMCLKAKIPVLCEKPIFFNKSEVDEFNNFINPSYIAENISFMFDTQVTELINSIKRELYGEILEIKICIKRKINPLGRSRIMNKYTSKGALHDIGMYGIFFLTSIFSHIVVIQQKINFEFENDYSGEIKFLGNNLIKCNLSYSIDEEEPISIMISGSRIRIEVLDFLSHNPSIIMSSNSSSDLTVSKNGFYTSNLARTITLVTKEISINLPSSNFVPLHNSLRTAELIFEVLSNRN